jgi:hypothetical protein
MKLFKTMNLLAIVLMFISFKNTPSPIEELIVGEYGICAHDNTTESSINLKLQSNHTFTYREVISSNETISSAGNWSLKNNSLVLNNIGTSVKMPLVWHADSNASFLKARKGLKFYRICNLKTCK